MLRQFRSVYRQSRVLTERISREIQYASLHILERILRNLKIYILQHQLSDIALYNPVPELGVSLVTRNNGSWLRWNAIKEVIGSETGSVIDVGCANGFFALRMAAQGFIVLGIDKDSPSIEVANLAAESSDRYGISFMKLSLDPACLAKLPQADYVLFMSVFQQWAVQFGFDTAMEMLNVLWSKAKVGMFFETAESDSCKAEYAACLPKMGEGPDACSQFLQRMLANLNSSVVTCLGYFPTDYRLTESRHLFFVARTSER